MSFFDTSAMIPVFQPELTPVPTQPANQAVGEAQGGGAQDSTSSSSGSLAGNAQAVVDVVELNSSGGQGRGGSQSGSQPLSPQAQAAAALVDINGASSILVDEYQLSVPPNLATATQLLSQITSRANLGAAGMGAAYQLLSPSATLALTSD